MRRVKSSCEPRGRRWYPYCCPEICFDTVNLNENDAAKSIFLGVGRDSVYRLVKAERLSAHRKSHAPQSPFMIDRASLEAYDPRPDHQEQDDAPPPQSPSRIWLSERALLWAADLDNRISEADLDREAPRGGLALRTLRFGKGQQKPVAKCQG